MNPRFPQYLANLGRCWLARREPNKFLEHVAQLPDDVRVVVMDDYCNAILSDCLRQGGDPVAASKLRRSLIDAGSRDAVFYNDEAKYLIESQQPQQALDLLTKAEKLGIGDEFTQSIRASALAATGKPGEASKLRMSLIDAGSRNVVFYADEAKYLIESQQPQQALELLTKAEKLGIADKYLQSIGASALAAASRDRTIAAPKVQKPVAKANIAGDSTELQDVKHRIREFLERGDFSQAMDVIDAAGSRGLIDRDILELRRQAAAGQKR